MKKKFQIFLVFFLTYAFICCPVFVGSSFAENNTTDSSPTAKVRARFDSILATVTFIKDSLPEWFEELNFPPTSSEEIQENKVTRETIVKAIRDQLGINRK